MTGKQLIACTLTVFALMVSWFLNKSVLWALFHGIFSVIYLIYAVFMGYFSNGNLQNIINYYF